MAKDTTTLPDTNLFKTATTPDEALIQLLNILDRGREFLAAMTNNFVVPEALKQSNMIAMIMGFDTTRQMLNEWLALPEMENE